MVQILLGATYPLEFFSGCIRTQRSQEVGAYAWSPLSAKIPEKSRYQNKPYKMQIYKHKAHH